MATNKERIELLESGLSGLQNDFTRMEGGLNDKLKQFEEAISNMSALLVSNRVPSNPSISEPTTQTPIHSSTNPSPGDTSQTQTEEGRQLFFSKLAKLEFPRFSGGDPTEWFAKVDQFFEYHNTVESQKIPLASFHLEGEANQWWQWLRRSCQDERQELTWKLFQEEIWARFGPTDCEDFDEALAKIKQVGQLREYQQEFDRLGNRVHGWSQKALVGTFIGGLKSNVAPNWLSNFLSNGSSYPLMMPPGKIRNLSSLVSLLSTLRTRLLPKRGIDAPRRSLRVPKRNPKYC